ncbi:YHYH domain-containing protein [Paenibacillus sp. PL91]|uniref:YHYH domain-containing protein n=1 Tax=Paenibacillus sp. PL91 TaxID=2729538 RepID=UPI00145CA5F3|nr:YHYH domain-containing protein [Paenibacillus sp. PL91]MBC9205166.1 YHYH domain-containing protein [Paenibacillus sp. PL91]
MRKVISLILTIGLLAVFIMPSISTAHSGRTDSSGGHNCSEKSIAKGLCTGYHYHNGGSSGSSGSGSSSVTKEKVIYNEFAPEPHCIFVKDVYTDTDTYYKYYERLWDCNLYSDEGTIYTNMDNGLIVNNNKKSLSYANSFISVKNQSYFYAKDFAKAFGLNIEVDKNNNLTLSKKGLSIKIDRATNKIFLNGEYTNLKVVRLSGLSFIPFRYAVKWVGGKITSIDYDFSVEYKS